MRLLLVHAGGTLMMRGGRGTPMAPSSYTHDLLTELPVLAKIADVDTTILWRMDSSDMQPENWVQIARTIHDALPDYDGVVVVHGTDTMAYTASALALLLRDLDKPVVITGSQRPIDRIRSDARQNLVDAFGLATLRVPEVGIAFASKLLRGCRATKVDAWGLDAFGTPNCPPLAKLGVGIELADHVLAPRERTEFDDRIEPRVLAVRLFPGLDPALLRGALRSGVRGLVLMAFGAGNVPMKSRSLRGVLEAANDMDIPVVITSQCLRAHVDLQSYAGGVASLEAGAISAGDMTDEAVLAKLMISLARSADGNHIEAAREAFAHAWVGEMDAPMPVVREANVPLGAVPDPSMPGAMFAASEEDDVQ
jgi:L-asparaginase